MRCFRQDILRALRARDDEGLLLEAFEKHADGKDGAGQRTMSKDALVKALAALRVRRDEEQVDELMARVDLDGSGSIDFQEFQQEVGSRSRLEMLLQGLPLLFALADILGGSMEEYTKIQDCEVEAKVCTAVPVLANIIKDNLTKLRESHAAALPAAVGDKFSFNIVGGKLEDFHNGLAGRVGEPHADIEQGIEKEHLTSGDANESFTTSNYDITTTPCTEYMLVVTGGKGLKPAHSGHGRLFRPLEYYYKLDIVKKRKLGRKEIIAVILYTGPMFQVSVSIVATAIGFFTVTCSRWPLLLLLLYCKSCHC